MRTQYENSFVRKLGMSDTTKCVYQFFYNENDNYYTKIIQYLLCMDLYNASRQIVVWHAYSMHGD